MNDVQAWQATYARHERILARERRMEAAAAGETQAPKFAEALPTPAPATTPLKAEPPAVRIAEPAPVAAAPATSPAAAPVDMSSGQLATLMAAFGEPAAAEPKPAAATPAAAAAAAKAEPVAAPELTPDQAALLLQSFGIAGHGYGTSPDEMPSAPDEDAQTASIPSPDTQASVATGRFFPVQPSRQTASLDASDAYLDAMQNLERNLARRGVR